MRKMPAVLALALSMGLGACHDSPTSAAAPAPVAAAAPAPAPAVRRAQPSATPARRLPVSRAAQAAEPVEAPLDPHGVLDDEERRLLTTDDAILTRDERVARAEAQKKLVMADPEHPLRPVLAKIEEDVASGAYATMARDMYAGRTAFPDRDDDEPPSHP
jgi:hypothetical protein